MAVVLVAGSGALSAGSYRVKNTKQMMSAPCKAMITNISLRLVMANTGQTQHKNQVKVEAHVKCFCSCPGSILSIETHKSA